MNGFHLVALLIFLCPPVSEGACTHLESVRVGPCSDFRGKVVTGQRFVGMDLSESDFSAARMAGSAVERSKLTLVSMRESVWRNGQCLASSFFKADLRGMTGEHSVWRECDLAAADLRGAKLKGVIFDGVSFTGTDLRFADLRGAGFTRCNLDNARLEGAAFDALTRLPFDAATARRRGMIEIRD